MEARTSLACAMLNRKWSSVLLLTLNQINGGWRRQPEPSTACATHSCRRRCSPCPTRAGRLWCRRTRWTSRWARCSRRGTQRPLAAASSDRQRYLYAVVFALNYWRHPLLSTAKCTIRTDHQSLTHLWTADLRKGKGHATAGPRDRRATTAVQVEVSGSERAALRADKYFAPVLRALEGDNVSETVKQRAQRIHADGWRPACTNRPPAATRASTAHTSADAQVHRRDLL